MAATTIDQYVTPWDSQVIIFPSLFFGWGEPVWLSDSDCYYDTQKLRIKLPQNYFRCQKLPILVYKFVRFPHPPSRGILWRHVLRDRLTKTKGLPAYKQQQIEITSETKEVKASSLIDYSNTKLNFLICDPNAEG
jgi:hypothetical protein